MLSQEFKTEARKYFRNLVIIVAIILIVAVFSLRGRIGSKLNEFRVGRQVVGVWDHERAARNLEAIPRFRSRWEFDEETFTLTTHYYFTESDTWALVHEAQGSYDFIKRPWLTPSYLRLHDVRVRRSQSPDSVKDIINLRTVMRLVPVEEDDPWAAPRIEFPAQTVRFSRDGDVLSMGSNLMGVASFQRVD